MKVATALSALVSSLFVTDVLGHGYMIQPAGRTNTPYSDPEGVVGCDSDAVGPISEYAAGEEVEVIWSRNNHIGGFIRFSMVPRDAVNGANFDKNTFYYTCRESDCSLTECKDKFCPDDAGATHNEITCKSKIKMPDYLEAGDYTMQWTWHSAGSSYGHIGWSTGNWKTCADIKLTTSGSGSKPSCPTFVGGDRVTKDFSDEPHPDTCYYFDENGLSSKLMEYSDEEGLAKYFYGKPKEVEACAPSAPEPAETMAPEPAETPAPEPAETPAPEPAETPAPEPAETMAPEPAETVAPPPAETEAPAPAETMAPAPAETSAPAPASGGAFVYIGPNSGDTAYAAGLTQWCNQNCPGFCPGDMCKAA